MINKKSGFTLSEILVTITILGIVSVLVIPNIYRKWQDMRAVMAVKLAYSILENSLREMYIMEDTPETWNWPESISENNVQNNQYFFRKLTEYIKIKKFCENFNGCAFSAYTTSTRLNGVHIVIPLIQALDGTSARKGGLDSYFADKNNISGIMANGMSIAVGNVYKEPVYIGKGVYKNLWGYIMIDINGTKKPNRYGYDIFFFQITDEGIDLSFSWSNQKKACHASAINGNSPAGSYTGFSCSTWIMKHGNVDYKYKDVQNEW